MRSIEMKQKVLVVGLDGAEAASMKPPTLGKGCTIESAIIDKNVHIGDNCVISPKGKPDQLDGDHFYIRDGIVVIPKGAVIPADTWI